MDSAISELIGTIYDNPWSGGSWQPVIEQIAQLTDSSVILLSAFDIANRQLVHGHWHGPDNSRFLDAVRDYESDMHKHDPLVIYASSRLRGGAVTATSAAKMDLLDRPDDLDYMRWQQSELGIGDGTLRYTAATQPISLCISMHPSLGKGEHSAAERRLFLMLFDHVERAIRLAARMPTFDKAGEAVLLVDAEGRVRQISEPALSALAHNDGLQITGGRLRATRLSDDAALGQLLRVTASAGLETGPQGIAISRPSGKRPWLILPTLYRREQPVFGTAEAQVLIRIFDPEETPNLRGSDAWKELFGLTAAELRVAQAFVAADGNFAHATEQLGMVPATGRVHLRRLFDKTGARGQASLVRLLSRIEA